MRRFLSSSLIAGSFALLPAAVPCRAQNPAEPAESLLPADFTRPLTDVLGFQWEIHPNGYIVAKQGEPMAVSMALFVNGRPFEAQRRKMGAVTGEFVLSAAGGPLEVTRRVKFDAVAGGVRYVDVVRNTGDEPIDVALALACYPVDRSHGVVGEDGREVPDAGAAGRDAFLVLRPPGPSALFCVGAAGARVKPVADTANQGMVTLSYRLSIQGRETVPFLHAVGLRRIAAAQVAREAPGLFLPFRSPRFTADLPASLRRTLVNADTSAAGLPPWSLPPWLDVWPGVDDALVLGGGRHRRGTARGGPLTVRTAHGTARVALAEVGVLVGGGRGGRPGRVYLRDGDILAGDVEAPGLALAMDAGEVVPADPGRLEALVLRAGASSPAAAPGGRLETPEGDRLALTGDLPPSLDIATPWGGLQVPFDHVLRVRRLQEPRPRQEVLLRDGTRVEGILRGGPMRFASRRLGPVELAPHLVMGFVAAGGGGKATEGATGTEPPPPRMRLRDDTVLAGGPEAGELAFLAGGGRIALNPARLLLIRRAAWNSFPNFLAERVDGPPVIGRWEVPYVNVRTADRAWRVPVEHLVSLTGPATRTAPLGHGLQAEYFSDAQLANRAMTRVDLQVDFDWGDGTPDPRLPVDGFSARWTGTVEPRSSGRYTFYIAADDGVRLWIDDRLVIDHWHEQPGDERPGTASLIAGNRHALRLEYYEASGSARVVLSWSGPEQPKEVIPRERLFPPEAQAAAPSATGAEPGLEPDPELDVLVGADGVRRRGTARGGDVRVESSWGRVDVPFDGLAGLIAPPGKGAPVACLRDGQRVRGRVTVSALRFAPEGGVEADISPDAVSLLIMRRCHVGMAWAGDERSWVETAAGDRLLIESDEGSRIALATPWGPCRLPARDLLQFASTNAGPAGHGAFLRDGSVLGDLLDAKGTRLHTALFGEREFTSEDIRRLNVWNGKPRAVSEIREPRFVTAGFHIFVGLPDLPAFHVRTTEGEQAIAAGDVRRLSVVPAEGGGAGEPVRVEVEVWGKGAVSGVLREIVIPVRAGGTVFTVPAGDVLYFEVPNPVLSPELTARIAALIADLGHAQWERREDASRALAAMGALVRGPLRDALDRSDDAEVRARVLRLLEAIAKGEGPE